MERGLDHKSPPRTPRRLGVVKSPLKDSSNLTDTEEPNLIIDEDVGVFDQSITTDLSDSSNNPLVLDELSPKLTTTITAFTTESTIAVVTEELQVITFYFQKCIYLLI